MEDQLHETSGLQILAPPTNACTQTHAPHRFRIPLLLRQGSLGENSALDFYSHSVLFDSMTFYDYSFGTLITACNESQVLTFKNPCAFVMATF